MITPQYPAARTYTAQIAVKKMMPNHEGQPNRYVQTLPIAAETHATTNMFMNVCHPASHPRRSSEPSPE